MIAGVWVGSSVGEGGGVNVSVGSSVGDGSTATVNVGAAVGVPVGDNGSTCVGEGRIQGRYGEMDAGTR